MEEQELSKYCQFIRVISKLIEEHFEDQKEYIHCKEGCAHCCKNGEYPCSKLEFDFLKIGFMTLPMDVQQKIVNKIVQLKAEKSVFTGERFIHECPFLIDNRCSVYNFRMIICRTFGLTYYEKTDPDKPGTIRSPFCMEQGLNYSDVFDQPTKTFSKEKFIKSGHKKEPIAYKLGLENLKHKFGQEVMDLDFGETKALLEWL